MPNSYGQADLRGLQIDTLAKGFADEEIILKKYCQVSTASNLEIRWFQKTAGFLDSTDTSGIIASQISNVGFGSRPEIVGQTWTKNTSYVKKYFVGSELISDEFLRDCPLDVIGTTVRDLVRAVEHQVDLRIYNVITENDTPATIQTIAITDEWDDLTNGKPLQDLLQAREYLRNYNYDPDEAILVLRPDALRFLVTYLIVTKGSSIPNFSSSKVESGTVMKVCGFDVIDNTICTSDKAVIFVKNRACTWYAFSPIKSQIVEEPMIGKRILVSEEGEAVLTDPKAVVFFSNVGPS